MAKFGDSEETACGWDLERLRANDAAAWRHAFRDLWSLARRVIRRRVFSEEAANDLAQDVLVSISQNVARFASDTHVKIMTTIVARRRAAHFLRDETAGKRDRRLETSLDAADAVESPAGVARLAMELKELLERLDPLDRSLLEGHYLEGLTSQELAKRHDLNANTIRTRMKRAIESLGAIASAAPLELVRAVAVLLALRALEAAGGGPELLS